MKQLLLKEIQFFRKLSQNAQEVFFSNVLFGAGSILSGIFVNAFLITSSESINSLIYYNGLFFIGVYIAFVLNAVLLKFFKINYIYLFGLVLQGVIPIIIVLISKQSTTGYLFGLISGLGAGFYWANRNYLEVDSTKDENRNYFYALHSVADTFTGTFIPIVVGYIIGNLEAGFKDSAYLVTMILSLILMISSGLVLLNNQFHKPPIRSVFIGKSTLTWNLVRFASFMDNIIFAVMAIVPGILILKFIGDEASLGLIETVGAIVSAISIYIVGRKIKENQRVSALLFGTFISLLATLTLNLYFGVIGIVFFILLYRFGGTIRGNSYVAMVYQGMEFENKSENQLYKYIVDAELFLNLGRLTILAIFLYLVNNFDLEFSIKIISILVFIAHILVYLSLRKFRELIQIK